MSTNWSASNVALEKRGLRSREFGKTSGMESKAFIGHVASTTPAPNVVFPIHAKSGLPHTQQTRRSMSKSLCGRRFTNLAVHPFRKRVDAHDNSYIQRHGKLCCNSAKQTRYRIDHQQNHPSANINPRPFPALRLTEWGLRRVDGALDRSSVQPPGHVYLGVALLGRSGSESCRPRRGIHRPQRPRRHGPGPRNLAGNPDSPQAVIFLTSIRDVIMGL